MARSCRTMKQQQRVYPVLLICTKGHLPLSENSFRVLGDRDEVGYHIGYTLACQVRRSKAILNSVISFSTTDLSDSFGAYFSNFSHA